MIWNIKKVVFNVRVKWTNGVTTDCLLMCWIIFQFSHFITWTLDNCILHFQQRKRQTESVIIVWKNSADVLIGLKKIQYGCCRYVKRFVLLLYQFTDISLPNYNSHSIQYAEVTQPDMKEITSMTFSTMYANELQTDGCTAAGRILSVLWGVVAE